MLAVPTIQVRLTSLAKDAPTLMGALNLAGLLIVMLVRRYEFTSIWCAYAAVVSVVIYFFFRKTRPTRPAGYATA